MGNKNHTKGNLIFTRSSAFGNRYRFDTDNVNDELQETIFVLEDYTDKPQIAMANAEKVLKGWNEYDKLKEDNEKLQAYSKDLIESNIDLSNVRNRLHEEKMKLREDNALLIEALENVLMELKCYDWSKETEPVYNKAKELLNNIKTKQL